MFAETFSIVVSMMIFGVMWNAYSSERSRAVFVLASGYLFTAYEPVRGAVRES